MKKMLIIVASVAALFSLASCQKEENPNGESKNVEKVQVSPVFTASINAGTKTTVDVSNGKVAWESSDEITVEDAGKNTAVYKIEKIDEISGKASFIIKEGETNLGAGPYTAIYGTVPSQSQIYSATVAKLYMTAPETSADNFTFTVQCGLMELNLTKTGESVKSIAVTGTPAGGTEATYTLVCNDAQSIGTQKTFYIALPAGSYDKIVLTNDKDIKCTLTAASGVAISANQIKPVSLGEDKIKFLKSAPEGFVDLGVIVNGKPVFWGEKNLGAENPWDCGKYFFWGDVIGQTPSGTTFSTKFSWENVPFGKTFNIIPQATACPDGILASDYDAAFQASGGTQRMPAAEEFTELCKQCFAEWTDNYDNKNVAGLIVWKAKTGDAGWFKPSEAGKGLQIKEDGSQYNSKEDHTFSNTYDSSIDSHVFFPAAGFGLNSTLNSLGVLGYCWSSTHYPSNPINAHRLNFNSGHVNPPYYDEHRNYGYSIRPVSD